MTTFTALGDSITLGVGDPVRQPTGARAWRGWAALLAETMHEPELHNLAVNGATAALIARDQLPQALSRKPDVASVVFGINDTLRPGFDPARIEAAAAHTVGALRAAGAEVLTMRLPDSGWLLGLPTRWPSRWPGARTRSTPHWTRSPSGSTPCTSMPPAPPPPTRSRCGPSTGCIRTSADTG